jgi:hypothetical protein
MPRTFFSLSLLLLLIGAKSCSKDTCNKEDTFARITLADAAPRIEATLLPVRLAVDLKTILPDAYFQAAIMDQGKEDRFGEPWENQFEKVEKLEMTAEKAIVYLKESSLQQPSERISLHFMLPDRKNYITCEHPGSADKYLLDLTFTVDKGTSGYQVKDLLWKEQLKKGGF